MKKLILLFFASTVIFSCKKDKDPVILPIIDVSDSSQVFEVNLGENYSIQAFVNIDDLEIVSTNDKTVWDLGARFVNDIPHIFLNSSKNVKAVKVDNDFSETISDQDLNLKWDKPDGKTENFYIGNQLNKTFVITVGYDNSTRTDVYKKIIIFKDGNTYKIKSADLDSQNESTISLSKIPETDFVTFNLNQFTGNQVYPKDNKWDLLFSQYTTEFEDGTPYQVTGVLLNTTSLKAVKLSENISFDNIDLDLVNTLELTNRADIIGYDWKEYIFEGGYYAVDTRTVYILKKGNEFHKLKFVDFYNSEGKKGNIKFEIQKI